jgi:hypothetical protein
VFDCLRIQVVCSRPQWEGWRVSYDLDTARRKALGRETFEDLFRRLKSEQYNGVVTVHLAQGSPNHVEIPCEPQRIVLDKPNRRMQT